MNNLEKKFYEYLLNHIFKKVVYDDRDLIILANDLAEITISNRKYLDRVEVEKTIENIFIENKLIVRIGDEATTGEVWAVELMDDIITAICNLAIPENKQIKTMKDIIKSLEHDVKFWKDKSKGIIYEPITREKLIDELNEYIKSNAEKVMYSIIANMGEEKFKQFITKILEGKEGEK